MAMVPNWSRWLQLVPNWCRSLHLELHTLSSDRTPNHHVSRGSGMALILLSFSWDVHLSTALFRRMSWICLRISLVGHLEKNFSHAWHTASHDKTWIHRSLTQGVVVFIPESDLSDLSGPSSHAMYWLRSTVVKPTATIVRLKSTKASWDLQW